MLLLYYIYRHLSRGNFNYFLNSFTNSTILSDFFTDDSQVLLYFVCIALTLMVKYPSVRNRVATSPIIVMFFIIVFSLSCLVCPHYNIHRHVCQGFFKYFSRKNTFIYSLYMNHPLGKGGIIIIPILCPRVSRKTSGGTRYRF